MRYILEWFFPKSVIQDGRLMRSLIVGIFFAAILVLQLFTYDEFSNIVMGFELPGGEFTLYLVLVLLPVIEFLSVVWLVGFDIGHRVASIMRWLPVVVGVFWASIALYLSFLGWGEPVNFGIFGATLPVAIGPESLILAFMMLAVTLVVFYERSRSDQ